MISLSVYQNFLERNIACSISYSYVTYFRYIIHLPKWATGHDIFAGHRTCSAFQFRQDIGRRTASKSCRISDIGRVRSRIVAGHRTSDCSVSDRPLIYPLRYIPQLLRPIQYSSPVFFSVPHPMTLISWFNDTLSNFSEYMPPSYSSNRGVTSIVHANWTKKRVKIYKAN